MTDLNTRILIEIRDEIRATRTDLSARIDETNSRLDLANSRIDQTNSRLDETNSRLDETNSHLDQTNSCLDRLERRQVDAEIGLSTEIVALTGAVHELRDTLLEDRHLRKTVDNHEQRIRALETRT